MLVVFVPDYLLPNDPDITGINGAAISLLLSSLAGFILFRYYSLKHLGCTPHPRILTHIFSSGIMVTVLIFIGRVLELSEGFERVLAFAGLGIFVYGISLYLSGEFLRSDFKRFKDLTKEA
jgi:O-antigen/teichoic acid export membrane protein